MAAGQDLENIIKECVARDRVAFEHLYEHLIDRVYAYVWFRTNTKAEATDITQDIFIDLYTSLANFQYQSIPQFYSFVFTIAKRKLAKHYDTHTSEVTTHIDFPSEDMLPDEAETDVEMTDEVRRAVGALPEVAQEIIVLHHWSRYTFAEIATLLEMRESAVRVRHHRALKELAQLLDTSHSRI